MRYNFGMCGIVTSVLLLAHLAAGDDGARKLTDGQRIVIAEGAAWGVVNTLSDGSLGLIIQRSRSLEEIDATNVAMEWLRSTDGGKTWSDPVMIHERRSPDGKLYEPRPDGGYVVFQERNEAFGQLPSGRIVCAFCELNYHYDADGEQINAPGVNWSHVNQGIVYMWSDDLGISWSPPRQMTISPFGGAPPLVSPHWRIVSLSDGTALVTIYGSNDPSYAGDLDIPDDTRAICGVLRSTDNGETWGDASVILAKPEKLMWEETALCLLDDDKLIAHVRTGRHNIIQYVSSDKGRTWQGPTEGNEPGQQPGGAFRLQSGRLLCTWGNRRAPFGAVAMISDDEGATWDYDHRVSIAWDAHNGDCGYANGAQAGDGTIVVTYYDMGEKTSYRNLWEKSRVFVVRFTEEQFLAAAGITSADP